MKKPNETKLRSLKMRTSKRLSSNCLNRLKLCFIVLLVLVSIDQNSAETTSSRTKRANPDPLLNQISRSRLDLQKQNEHKPKFNRCDDYKPKLQEESPKGKPQLYFPIFLLYFPNFP